LAKSDRYDLSRPTPRKKIAAPVMPYEPRDPVSYRPGIGLIACGGITFHHLTAYKKAGYRVLGLCDLKRDRAEARRTEFYPDATVYTDYRELLKRDDIEVVDIATHPTERAPLIEAALKAGKHVLSQKPFVTDLDIGQKLVDLAARHKRKLAVNQNGRWAPHFSCIRHVIQAGILGELMAAHLSVHWDHSWIKGSEFEKVYHVVLYDFAIHWFDIVTQFFGDRDPERVFASVAQAPGQTIRPPLLGQALIEYPQGQATLVFDAAVRFGAQDRTYAAGTEGTITSVGPDLGKQKVTLFTAAGYATPELKCAWFDDGFHGTMAELLCAIEEGREPANSARGNLRSLALCFAAVASADTGEPVTPGSTRQLPSGHS